MADNFPIESDKSSHLTRRTLLAGTAVGGVGMALSGGFMGSAQAAVAPAAQATASGRNELCIAHHYELSTHMRRILDSAYVDDHMKNTVLKTTRCPHCQVAIAPAPSKFMAQAA